MDNLEKVEQLIAKTGCTYEEAKQALDVSGWDMIDAIIELEKSGKIVKESSSFRSGQAAAEPAGSEAKRTAKVEAEVVGSDEAEKIRPEGFGAQSGSYNSGKAGSSKTGGFREDLRKLWGKVRRILVNNRMIVIGKSGNQIIDLPIFIPVIALICFFWATLILAVVAMLFGCRFHFEGEDLGKTNINSTMDRATDYAEKVKNDFTAKTAPQGNQNGGQDTDH